MQQMEAAECGVACLGMILDYHGASIPLDELRQECGTSRDGNSALQLLKTGERLGLAGRGLRLDVEHLGTVSLPLVLHWRLNHFVVLERMSGGHALIVDPSAGRVKADKEQLNRCFSGVALEFQPTKSMLRRARKSVGITQYFTNLQKRLRPVVFVMLAGACTQLLGVVAPSLNQILIDEVIRPARHDWLLPVMAVLIGATAASFVLQWFYQLVMAHLQTALASSLTIQLGRRLLRLPLDFIESRSRADLMHRVNSYAALGDLLTRTAVGAFDGLFALTLAGLMLAYDWRLGALALGIDLLRIFVVRFVREDSRQRSAGELSARAREASVVLQATSSAETVKAFGLEGRLEEWYERRLSERLSWTVKSNRLSEGASRWLSIFDGAARAAVLWFGGMQVIEFQMTLGVFAGFLAIRGLLAGPLASILGTVEGWLEFKSVLTRTDELSAQEPLKSGDRSADELSGRLELRGVGFRYSSGSPWVFRGVSLTIEPGQHVALIGPSGQGKSTLLRIICGILAPTEGRVLLDGVDIRELDPASLAKRVGALVGEPLILEGSVRDNIVLRLPEEGDDAVRDAARAACFSEVVQRMPHGYETLMEAGGANLSGGERQRLGLAQALLGNPNILFLDEATCFLDAPTEGRVIQNTLHAGITVVSVAHRPRVISASHQVFLVKDGCVSPARADEAARAPRGPCPDAATHSMGEAASAA